MAMKLHFEEPAEIDFYELIDHYDSIRGSLGEEFIGTIFNRLDEILLFPASQSPISRKVRKVNLGRFPYQLIYQIRQDEIWVLAIWHNKRKPGSWKKRKKKP